VTAAALVCHPTTPAPWLDGIVVRLTLDAHGDLTLVYTLSGHLARLRLPPPTRTDRSDGLWRHTCCEAFVMGADAPAYREFNFSPAGAWQAYDFAFYRRGGLPARTRPPRIVCQAAAHRLVLDVRLTPQHLPAGTRLRLALCAVIEDREGRLSYWALNHPTAQADFHHHDAFALELDRA